MKLIISHCHSMWLIFCICQPREFYRNAIGILCFVPFQYLMTMLIFSHFPRDALVLLFSYVDREREMLLTWPFLSYQPCQFSGSQLGSSSYCWRCLFQTSTHKMEKQPLKKSGVPWTYCEADLGQNSFFHWPPLVPLWQWCSRLLGIRISQDSAFKNAQ